MPQVVLKDRCVRVTLTAEEVSKHGFWSSPAPYRMTIDPDGSMEFQLSLETTAGCEVAFSTLPALTLPESSVSPAPSTGRPAERPESLKSQGEPTSGTGKSDGRGRRKGYALATILRKKVRLID